MTLDECYAANQGKALLIPGGGAGNEGQCVQWADTVLHDVYGFDYHWGNAIDWWNNPGELLNNFDMITDGSIKKGDIVIFNNQVGSEYGHIDVAMSDGTTANFQGADSNWGGNKTVHLVQHTNPNYVLGSLRLKSQGGNEMTHDQNIDLARTLRLLAGEGVADANTHVEDDARHMDADPLYATALAKQLYNGEWQTLANDATSFRQRVKDNAQVILDKIKGLLS